MTPSSLVNPDDSLERQNEKLLQITQALMRRVEHGNDQAGAAYAQFERAALLEKRVRERTLELERTLDLLHDSNAKLAQANRETETARRNLADAIETVSEGFALFDATETLVMSNSRFCRDFLDTVADLRPGMSFDDYVRVISRSRYLALPSGENPSSWSERRIRRHKDRRVMFNVQLANDRWLQVSEHRTANGGTVILQTDVTDLIRLERQERARLKDKQTRMIKATLDHLNQGVCIFDEHSQLVGWNQKIGVLLGLPARRLHIGVRFVSLLEYLNENTVFTRGLDRAQFAEWASSTGPRRPIFFEVKRGDITALQIFGQGMPDGGFLISCTDVTAEREAARKLQELNEDLEQRVMERTLELEDALSAAERANASKSRFVAAASHDLLQPLSAAKLFVSSLSDRDLGVEENHILNKAERALAGAEQIIDALLDISKLDSDRLQFDIRPVALNELLIPLRDEMEALAINKGLELRIVPSSMVVETDPAYMRRVLQNLMGNALRYTQSGRVLVGARRRGGTARVEVWDTGPGIAEEDQSTVFEEFKRLDTTASTNDGLGLGLAIVERACARLGHPLSLRSEPGSGSCFMVSMPTTGVASPEQTIVQRPDRPRDLAQAGLIVLLVENDPQMNRAMTILLESWGVNVLGAENGEAALELLTELELTPDALLFDYQLGHGMSGTELFCEIRDRLGIVPCTIISATRSEKLRTDCQKLEIELMLKPLNRHCLSEFLKGVAKDRLQTAQ